MCKDDVFALVSVKMCKDDLCLVSIQMCKDDPFALVSIQMCKDDLWSLVSSSSN